MPNIVVSHDDLERFKSELQELMDERTAQLSLRHPLTDPALNAVTIEYEVGRRYARYFVTGYAPESRSAYAFVDLTNGALLKPDGWKGPARGSRGNILTGTAISACGPYGVAHAR